MYLLLTEHIWRSDRSRSFTPCRAKGRAHRKKAFVLMKNFNMFLIVFSFIFYFSLSLFVWSQDRSRNFVIFYSLNFLGATVRSRKVPCRAKGGAHKSQFCFERIYEANIGQGTLLFFIFLTFEEQWLGQGASLLAGVGGAHRK